MHIINLRICEQKSRDLKILQKNLLHLAEIEVCVLIETKCHTVQWKQIWQINHDRYEMRSTEETKTCRR